MMNRIIKTTIFGGAHPWIGDGRTRRARLRRGEDVAVGWMMKNRPTRQLINWYLHTAKDVFYTCFPRRGRCCWSSVTMGSTWCLVRPRESLVARWRYPFAILLTHLIIDLPSVSFQTLCSNYNPQRRRDNSPWSGDRRCIGISASVISEVRVGREESPTRTRITNTIGPKDRSAKNKESSSVVSVIVSGGLVVGGEKCQCQCPSLHRDLNTVSLLN